MRFKTYILIAIGFFYSSSIQCAQSTDAMTKKMLQRHVAYLSSDALEGRLTGAPGEKLATQYAAELFQRHGLEPAGDNGTFFQEFDFTSGVSLGKNNSFFIIMPTGLTKKLIVDQEWRPLSFSDNQSFKNAELVFAGYGITSPIYDSYHGLDVKNKWVIVFRYLPEKMNEEKRRQLSQYASLRYKAFIAKKNGAKGIIFVSGPNSNVKNELIPISFDTSFSHAGIVAISMKDAVVNELLKNNTKFSSLQNVQDKLDAGQLNVFPQLNGIKINGQIDVQQKRQRGRNVLARLKVSHDVSRIVMVGAHGDHLGRGEPSSSRSHENEIKRIHPGADDNASGVASVLEAAVNLSALKAQGQLQGNKDILFAIWSGEELGLLGSSHFINDFMKQTKNKKKQAMIDAYINLDMVGHLKKNLVLQGVGSSFKWPALINQANQKYALPLIIQSDPYLPTDSTSFYLHGIPALNFFTGAHDSYHTPRDKLDTLNIEGMKSISDFLVSLILALEADHNVMDYQQVQKTSKHTGRGFNVYLGTIPNYASADLDGVRLTGVTSNSPADRAGLRPEDVIVGLAGKKIHDVYDYTFVLRALHANVPVPLVVQRGQSRVKLTIVPQPRE